MTSAEGKELKSKVWAEIVKVLAAEDPAMENLIGGLASGYPNDKMMEIHSDISGDQHLANTGVAIGTAS